MHFPQVGAVVITQCTEMGTVYSLDQVRALVKMAKSHRAHVLMDGARFCNALVSLGCTPAELTWESGVDVLVCGNSKLGGALAEAVVFFNTTLAQGFRARVKQAGQLLSKARFYTAPWVPMIKKYDKDEYFYYFFFLLLFFFLSSYYFCLFLMSF